MVLNTEFLQSQTTKITTVLANGVTETGRNLSQAVEYLFGNLKSRVILGAAMLTLTATLLSSCNTAQGEIPVTVTADPMLPTPSPTIKPSPTIWANGFNPAVIPTITDPNLTPTPEPTPVSGQYVVRAQGYEFINARDLKSGESIGRYYEGQLLLISGGINEPWEQSYDCGGGFWATTGGNAICSDFVAQYP